MLVEISQTHFNDLDQQQVGSVFDQPTEYNGPTSLPGVGFHPEIETQALKRDLLGVNETNRRKVFEDWIQKTIKNLRGYWQEYIDQRAALPIELQFETVDGVRRIVQKGISSSLWVDSVNTAERNGSIKRTVVQIEEFLVDAPPNSVAVFVSPGGNEYPDTQTYIFWTDAKGELDGVTVRTDPVIEDNESFVKSLVSNFDPLPGWNLDSRVEYVILSPALLPANDGQTFSPEKIVERIKETKRGHLAYKGKSFDEIYKDFKDRLNLGDATTHVGHVIDEFSSFCRILTDNLDMDYDQEMFAKLEVKITESVLKMSYIRRHLTNTRMSPREVQDILNNLDYSDYRGELAYLQTRRGCAGGGLGTYSDNGLGLRETSNSGNFVRNCGKCGVSINAHISKGYVCSSCKEVYEGC